MTSANEDPVRVEQVTPTGDDAYQVVLTVAGERREVLATVVVSRGVEGITFDPYPFEMSGYDDPRPVAAAVLAVHRGETAG